jgi:hypothetical protein
MSRSTSLPQNGKFPFFLYFECRAAQRACPVLLLTFVAAWLLPIAIAQSVTPLDAHVLHAADVQPASRGPISTVNEEAGREVVNATVSTSHFNIQVQAACETEMLHRMNAHEVFSGKAYEVLTRIAPAYGRTETPHIYIFPRSWNMVYIAGSTAVDGRGKILVGKKAIELFDVTALKGFLGHEMAHLASDNAAYGCMDYITRDPHTEADADAFAAHVLGMEPVKAFLERVLALPEGKYSDAKSRIALLQ